jgi:LysM repeat protein
VAAKPVVTADLSKSAEVPAAETTVYIVQRGDYLAKISKKFNITISSIKRHNPSIGEKNIVRVGQKLKLPGKVDVGVQAEPAKAPATAAKSTAKKPYAPYSGATKEYVVKSGDTLGGIAYGNGINIRQLKELNGLQKDSLRIGQKLKVPAEKVVADKPAAKAVEKKEKAEAAAPAAAPAETAPAADEKPLDAAALADAVANGTTTPASAVTAAAPAPAAGGFTTYVVQEGDDMTGVSIRWGVSAAEIRELNNLGEKDQLVPGQIIKLPADAQQ